MKLKFSKRHSYCGMTIVESMVAMGIGTIVLAGFTTVSIALQKSFVAIEDYAKGQNDQMRISDYLSLDMRRAFNISITGSSAAPPLTVTLVIPNYYNATDPTNILTYDPYVGGVTGWPYKKHHHHKHQNIILNQVVDYGPYDPTLKKVTTPTMTVTYVFDNNTSTLSRSVNGVASTIATDVKDFNVSVSDLDETAQTQITFKPRFNNPASADAVAGTTYFQTTLTRNTR